MDLLGIYLETLVCCQVSNVGNLCLPEPELVAVQHDASFLTSLQEGKQVRVMITNCLLMCLAELNSKKIISHHLCSAQAFNQLMHLALENFRG